MELIYFYTTKRNEYFFCTQRNQPRNGVSNNGEKPLDKVIGKTMTKTMNITNLYSMRKAFSEDRAAESGFESAANVTHISPEMSVVNAFANQNRGGTMDTP